MKLAITLLASLAVTGWAAVMRPGNVQPRNQVEQEWSGSVPNFNKPDIKEKMFKDGSEFRYLYDSQILTGMPHIHYQFAGARIRAIVNIQLGQKDIMQIEKVFVGSLHERFVSDPRTLIDISAFEPVSPHDAPFEEILKKPVSFSYENGKVDDFEALEDDPSWSINIKRAILSQFHLSLTEREEPKDEQRKEVIRSGLASMDKLNEIKRDSPKKFSDSEADHEVFTVMEDGIAGRCEVSYLVMEMPFDEERLLPIDELLGETRSQSSGPSSPVRKPRATRPETTDPILNITKTFDYKNCEFRPYVLQGLHMTSVCPACESNPDTFFDLLESAAHTRYNITGTKEQYLIDSAITEAVYKVTPRSHYAGSFVAYANITMILISSGPVRSPVNFPQGSVVQIDGLHMINPKFSHREGDKVFYTSPEADKPMLQKREYWPDVNGKPNKIKALFEKLVQGMEEKEIESEVADLVIYITRYLEHAFVEEIQQVHNLIKGVSVPGVQKEEIEHLFADLLVTTGTNCTFTYLKKLIVEKQLTGPVVRDILALLPFKMNVDKISPKMFEDYQEMCESEPIQSDPFTKRACALSLGTLVHKACAHNPFDAQVEWPKVKDNGEKGPSGSPRRGPRQASRPVSEEENLRCPTETRQQLVQKAIEYLKNADSDEQKILTIKVLGNMGLNETIDELAEIIEDDETPIYIRTQAIYALKHVAPELPVAITEILLPVYRNTSNPTQVRIAAFVILLVSQPELPVIQHVAQSLNREPDLDVASYVYSSMINVANSTDPCMKNLTENILLALEFVKPVDTDLRHSKSLHGGIYVDQMKRGLFWESNLIADKESPVPRAANFRLHANLMAKSFDLVEFGYETEGFGDTLRKYIGNYTTEHIQDVISGRAPRHPRQAPSDTQVPSLEQIPSLINMEPRKPKEIRGTAYVKLFGQSTRLVVINPQTMSRLLVELITQSQSVVPQLTGPGLPLDQRRASLLMNVRLEMPTVMGVPIKSGVQVPIVASVRGKLKVNMDPKPEQGFSMLKQTPQRVMIESDVKTSIAAEMHAKLRVFLGFLKVGTGVRSKMSFTAPISGKMEFTLKDKMTKMTMDMPDKSMKLVKMETYPVTYVQHYSASSTTFQTSKLTVANLQPKTRSSLHEESSEESSEVRRSMPPRPTGPGPHTGEAFLSLNVTQVPTEMLTKTGQVPFTLFNGLPIPTMDMREIATPDFIKSRRTHLTIGKETVAAKVEIKATCEYPDTEIPTRLLPILGSKAQMEVKLSPNPGHKKLVVTVFERTEYSQKAEKELLNKLKDKMPDMTLKDLERTTPLKDLDKLYKAGHSLQVLINSEGTDAPDTWTTRGLLAVLYTLDGRYTKVVAGVNSKVPGMTKKMCLAGEIRMPDRNAMWMITPQSPVQNKSIQGNLDVSWGEECGAEKFIKLRLRVQKSKEQMEIEKEDLYDINGIPVPSAVGQQVRREERLFESLYKSCEEDRNRGAFFSKECVDFVIRYTDLLRVKFDIEYKNVSRAVRGILHKTERWIEHKYYWNTETMDIDVQNPENRISGLIEYSADRSYVDVKYQTPRSNVSLINIDLPLDVKPLSVMIPWTWPRLYGLSAPVACSITGPKVKTFDEVSDDMPLSQCWHVMTKDASEDSVFAVLVAAAGKNSLAKKLAIVFPGHRIEILPTGPVNWTPQTTPTIKNFHVKHNGQEVKDVTNPDKWATIPPNTPEDKMPLAWIHTELPETTGNKETILNIVSPVAGIRVKFDGSSVTILPSPLWKNSLVGLCGSYNGQPWDDKLLPNRTVVDQPEEVSRAFLLNTPGCDAEIPEVSDNKPTFKNRSP